MDASTDGGRGGDFGRVFVAVGWVCVVAVAVTTVIVGLPGSARSGAAVIVLTSAGAVSWSATLCTLDEPSWVTPCLVFTGVCGFGLDAVHPLGPGYLFCFMAVAALALRSRGPAAALAAGVVAVGFVAAEAAAAAEPLSTGLTTAIGVGFVFVATKFAGMNRDATIRAHQLHAQQRATHAAQSDAAVLAERTRLARELHDVLAHTLSGLSIQLEGARLLAELTVADERLTNHINVAHQMTREGLINARQAVAALRSDAPVCLGQLPALIEQTRRTTQLDITFRQLGTVRVLPPESDLVIFRTVQEGLTNAAKHAGPQAHVVVSIRWAADLVAVDVSDSGGGPTAESSGVGGYGLAGLRERAALSGGEIIAGRTSGGWQVHLHLPIATTADWSGNRDEDR